MNVSKKAVFAALTAVLTIALSGAMAPSAGATPLTAKITASPKSQLDCNNTAARNEPWTGVTYKTCADCLKDQATLDNLPNSGWPFRYHFCTYNPSQKHYDMHVHNPF
ncbi:hypothetical protein [Streptomyces sp. NPDC006739]|uniref:hypothetical protein n=1 Tax=Streptomyces sp. NPDC006739 TaxID=3364763 RepID=UPI0036A5A9CF